MFYLAVIGIVILFVVLYLDAASKNRKKERIDKIRNSWGAPKTDDFNFYRIGRYAAVSKVTMRHTLSQQTLDDIDFQQIFAFIDRTTSAVGQQFLFRKVLHPFNAIDDLRRLSSFADRMGVETALREEIQKELIKLDGQGAYDICNLIHLKVARGPTWFKYLYINLILILVLIALSVKFPVCLILLIIPVTINTTVHYWNKMSMSTSLSSLPKLNTVIDVARDILKKANLVNGPVEESLHALKNSKWKLFLLNSSDPTMRDELGQVGSYLSELLRGIFLIEVFALSSLAKDLEKKRSSVSILFDFIGEIDTSISIASLRAGALETCLPRFVETKKEMSAMGVYHPLIRNCVRNDIEIHAKSVLITGSNMSGKTTFLRTMAINSILAQSIYTCFAEEFITPFVRQFSSIRIDDNLFEGKSYFFEEVNVIGLLIEEMQSGYQNLFILDEVFKGTNSIERTALGKAILSYLNRGDNMVIVSTHDAELSDLLKDEYELYHFSETIENGQLHFDHILKPGPLKTRNAIRLLELGNFPEEIIREARSLSADFPEESRAAGR